MLSLRNRFGIPGVISVLALVFALVAGGAYAADSSGDATASAKNRKGGGNVNKLIKREARKFSKVFSQRFAKRFPGPIGPQGFPGLPGAPGEDGDDGDDGSDGAKGAKGATGPTGPTGEEGPTGPTGEEGPTGPTGTFDSEGFTQTGTWNAPVDGGGQPFIPDGETVHVPVSFNIPLATAPTAVFVFGSEDKSGEGCDGIVGGAPTADPETLCIYQPSEFEKANCVYSALDPTEQEEVAGASRVGATLRLKAEGSLGCPRAFGVWATTG